MNITFDELRRIKHALPHGSIAKIARDLGIEEQTVRNYFGASQYENGAVVDFHLEPGPDGGIVHLENTAILEHAQAILAEHKIAV
jgi:predicted transcriptional regulator